MAHEDLAEATLLWTGWGDSAWPRRGDEWVIERFGVEPGTRLLAEVRALEKDFYNSDACDTEPDLENMGDKALAEFVATHGGLDPAIGEALRWCYTFDYL